MGHWGFDFRRDYYLMDRRDDRFSVPCPRYAGEKGHFLTTVQIVNAKGEMKGSAITGPVGKEAAELWPVSILSLNWTIMVLILF
jgi:hypothetical protein